jgi:dimeric dUTPase (all-alpha-NTP-PPase superfamily)
VADSILVYWIVVDNNLLEKEEFKFLKDLKESENYEDCNFYEAYTEFYNDYCVVGELIEYADDEIPIASISLNKVQKKKIKKYLIKLKI